MLCFLSTADLSTAGNGPAAHPAPGAADSEAGRERIPVLLRGAAPLSGLGVAAAGPGRYRETVRRGLRAQGLRRRVAGGQTAQTELGPVSDKENHVRTLEAGRAAVDRG